MRRAGRALSVWALVAALGLFPPRTAAVTSCADSQLPTLGNDSEPGYIPAGPALVSPGGAGYTYAINSSDFLQLYVQTAPGVGTTTSFTRRLSIALTGDGNETYPAANELVNSGCQMSWNYFSDLSAPPAGVSITQSASLTNLTDAANEPTCFFNHLYALNWDTFRGAYDSCGFSITTNDSMSVNGSYKIFHGRVHVKWEDWNATTGGTLVRPAASTWYDVTIQVQETANASSTTVTNTETPYNADFQVSSVTYSKDGTGAVTANIAFELTTAYPYYASVNGSTPSNYLIHSGTNYAGVTLTGDFTYTATLDGTKKANGQPCAVAGDVCKLSGILSYTWLPTTGSCSLSSEQAYQLDVTLECNSTGINSVCGKPMRDALALPSFGSFQLTGNIDFCKAATTNFPISWPVPFDVAGSSVRTIGAQIVTTGTLEANKKIYGIALKNYRVSRSGLTGEWSLWNAGATNVAYGDAGYDGSLTSVGTATGFVFSQPQSASNGLRWTVSASFTPNIRLFSGPQGFTTTAGQGNFMIVLPDDKGDQLTFRMAIDLRLYTDSMPFARRRLLYRDATIKTAQPAAVNDASASTNPISITVPENLQVSGDGSMTVIKTGALSIGAIAGIAVAGAVVGIAGIGIGLFVLKRKQRKHPPPAMDTEKQEKLRAPTFVMEGVPAWDEVLALPSAAVVFDRAQTPPSVSTLERKRSVLAQEKRETPLTNADKAKMAALMVPASSYIGSLNAQKSGTLPR